MVNTIHIQEWFETAKLRLSSTTCVNLSATVDMNDFLQPHWLKEKKSQEMSQTSGMPLINIERGIPCRLPLLVVAEVLISI